MATLMSLRDFIQTNVRTGPVTREDIEKTIEAGLRRGVELQHVCSLDGHVAVFGSTRCLHCLKTIR